MGAGYDAGLNHVMGSMIEVENNAGIAERLEQSAPNRKFHDNGEGNEMVVVRLSKIKAVPGKPPGRPGKRYTYLELTPLEQYRCVNWHLTGPTTATVSSSCSILEQ